eukprot:gene39610-63330_t
MNKQKCWGWLRPAALQRGKMAPLQTPVKATGELMNTTSHLQAPTSPTRDFAEQHMHTILARLAGPGAVPRAAQVDAVHAVLQPASRVLVVQATGWGKSAVYWAATHAIRSTGAGPTLV